MSAANYIAASIIFAGFGAGWLSARAPEAITEPARSALLVAPVHGGARAAAALERFERLAPPVVEPPPDAGPPPPPPPDVAVTFRRELTAIEHGERGLTAWIVDHDVEGARRPLRPGQTYRDGWVVASIHDQSVVLRRRRETRSIQIFDPPEPDQP